MIITDQPSMILWAHSPNNIVSGLALIELVSFVHFVAIFCRVHILVAWQVSNSLSSRFLCFALPGQPLETKVILLLFAVISFYCIYLAVSAKFRQRKWFLDYHHSFETCLSSNWMFAIRRDNTHNHLQIYTPVCNWVARYPFFLCVCVTLLEEMNGRWLCLWE